MSWAVIVVVCKSEPDVVSHPATIVEYLDYRSLTSGQPHGWMEQFSRNNARV